MRAVAAGLGAGLRPPLRRRGRRHRRLAVGFVVTTNALSSAAQAGLLADALAQYTGAGTVVSEVPDLRTAGRVLDRSPAPAPVNAQTRQAIAAGGKAVTDAGDIGSVATEPTLRWQHLVSGTYPTGAGQALVDARSAEQYDVHVGDALTLGEGTSTRTVRVTGTTSSSTGLLSAPVYVTWRDLEAFAGTAYVVDVVVASGDVSAVESAVPSRLHVEARNSYLQGVQAEITQGVDVIAVLLLVFAAIAFFVRALVIANTFTILLAQRARDFALLRCVGATRRQVRRGVLAEALVVAAAASTLGVLTGLVLGRGLVAGSGRVPAVVPDRRRRGLADVGRRPPGCSASW